MAKVASHTNNTGIANEKIDHINIFVGEYKWKCDDHKPTIQWCADKFGGKVYEKPRKTHKMQYRWRRGLEKH